MYYFSDIPPVTDLPIVETTPLAYTLENFEKTPDYYEQRQDHGQPSDNEIFGTHHSHYGQDLNTNSPEEESQKHQQNFDQPSVDQQVDENNSSQLGQDSDYFEQTPQDSINADKPSSQDMPSEQVHQKASK